jgi:uncharacterized protein
MNNEDVAAYLQANPEFFEIYADMLAKIDLTHPHDGRAIPLSERQLVQLRERNRVLEGKLRELVSYGEENDAIGERLHVATLALMRAGNLDDSLHSLYMSLREGFAVPHVALRMWDAGTRDQPEFAGVSEEARVFAESLAVPYCSAKPMFETLAWFGETEVELRSFAYVALRDNGASGLLALASEDAKRFYPEMGTLYLQRLGEIAAAGIGRYL